MQDSISQRLLTNLRKLIKCNSMHRLQQNLPSVSEHRAGVTVVCTGAESVGLTMPTEMHLLYVRIYCGHYDQQNLCNIINCNHFTRVYYYSVYFEEEQFVDYKCKNVKCMNISLQNPSDILHVFS